MIHYFYIIEDFKGYNMNIVFHEKKSLLLDTGLNEFNFGKRANGLNFSEKGMSVRFSLFDNNFQFSEWNFSGTTVPNSASNVCFEIENLPGKTAYEILTSHNDEQIARMTFALIKTISKAIESKNHLPCVGLGGIIYNEKPSKKNSSVYQIEINFLPESLFELSAINHDEKKYSKLQGFWQNKFLTGNNSLIFLQSVIAYYSLTNIFPFMKTNLEQRQEDIADSNFICIENLVNGINKNLATNINMGFHIDNHYEREKSLIPLDILQIELGLKDDGSYEKPKRDFTIPEEKFIQSTKNKQKRKSIFVSQKRFFKRYAVTIAISIITIFAIILFARNSYIASLEKPCVKNLTSSEIVQTFYSGFHQLKSDLMRLTAKGKKPREIIEMISNVYVSSQTRTAFEAKSTTISPELFLTRPELMDYWLFGITDFSIDGQPAYNRFTPITKKEFNVLKSEGKIKQFTEGQSANHIVKYNLIYSSGYPTPITIDKCIANVTCTFIKNQWFITDIFIEHSESQTDHEEFRNDYKAAFKESKDPSKTVEILRKKYNWLPDSRAMEDGKALAEYQKNYFSN